MFIDYKALVVVLILGSFGFWLGGRSCAGHMDPADFRRRRNMWFALTTLGFISPNIWIFAAIAMPLMYVAAKSDQNPLALYTIILFVVPNTSVPIPAIGIGQVFDVNLARMMALTILIPTVWRDRERLASAERTKILDWLLIAFIVYQLALLVPYESPTNTLRRGLLQFLDIFIVFYAFSRIAPNKRSLGEIAASFVVLGAILASISLFESLRGWLLYQRIPGTWGVPDLGSYLMRGTVLRAQASTGHSLVLGYTIAFCISCWLYVQSQQARSIRDLAVTILLFGGLIVTYSRGSWIMAVLVFVIFMAFRPGATRIFVRTLPILAFIGVVIYLSPLKEVIIDRLPIIGKADQDTIQYRQLVAEVSWRLIKQNPLFGDPYVANNLEELRQGQGIIDLINGYVIVTLYSGLVGLTLFTAFFVVAVRKCYGALRRWKVRDEQAAVFGAALLACMLSSLFFIATAGYGAIEYLLAGIIASYVVMGSSSQAAVNRNDPTALRRASTLSRSFGQKLG